MNLILTASIGSCLELFDFVNFAFLSTSLSKVFFNTNNGNKLIFTVLIFSTAYFFRPLGGLFFGYLADKIGRKSIYILTFFFMAMPSFLLAILPSYERIGTAATLGLISLRIVQGLAVGGEIPVSITYIAEFFSKKWRPIACCTLSVGANLGVGLSAFIIFMVTHFLSKKEMLLWGWRIPFLLGSGLAILAFYFRKQFSESPVFLALKEKGSLESAPLLNIFKFNRDSLFLGISLALLVSATTSTFHLFLPTYLVTIYKLPFESVMFISALGGVILALASFVFALFIGFFKKKHYLFLGTMSILLICIWKLCRPIDLDSLQRLEVLVILISISVSFINCIFMLILADEFPASRRGSGIALAYNLACLLGAGALPLIQTWILQKFAYVAVPFLSVGLLSLFVLLTLLYFHGRGRTLKSLD